MNKKQHHHFRLCAVLHQKQKIQNSPTSSSWFCVLKVGREQRQTNLHTRVSINKTWPSDFPTSKHKKAAAEPQLGFTEGRRQHSSLTSAMLKCISLASGRVTSNTVTLWVFHRWRGREAWATDWVKEFNKIRVQVLRKNQNCNFQMSCL